MSNKRGFTIVELMVVVSVISILVTIVFSSSLGAIRQARKQRAEALCRTVQSGIEAYHAKEDKWPSKLQDIIDRGFDDNVATYRLTASEVRSMVKVLVDEAKRGNVLMDISGLFVSRDPGESGNGLGLDFLSAIRGTNKSRKKMSTGEMYFGYPDEKTGHFRRFVMVYSVATDSLSVKCQGDQ